MDIGFLIANDLTPFESQQVMLKNKHQPLLTQYIILPYKHKDS